MKLVLFFSNKFLKQIALKLRMQEINKSKSVSAGKSINLAFNFEKQDYLNRQPFLNSGT
jgi:hypothetical protein